MLSEWINELLKKIEALTDIDVAKIGISLPKPEKGSTRAGKVPDDLQKTWTYIETIRKEMETIITDHRPLCSGGGPECRNVHEKFFALQKEEKIIEDIFWMLLIKEIKAEGGSMSICKNFEVYTSKEYGHCVFPDITFVIRR
jgi:hypothetical protein